MHKITSDFYDMRKILTKFFWSHGTPLGYLGPGSQQDVGLGACQMWFRVPWGPYEDPIIVVSHEIQKSPKTSGARCAILMGN